MSFDKQIQDKFSGFVPEVPEAHIDAGWEKISYFLPQQEKKKRAFFFYRRSLGIGIAALVVLIPVLTFFWMTEPQKTATVAALQRTIPAPRLADPEYAGTNEAVSGQRPGKKSGLKTAHGTLSAPAIKPTTKIHTVLRHAASASSTDQQRNSYRSAVAKKSQNTGQATDTSPAPNPSMAKAPLTSSDDIPASIKEESLAPGLIALLKQMPSEESYLSPDPKLALLSMEYTEPTGSNKTKPALELFCGLSNRSSLLKAEQDKKTVQANGFSAGISGIFPVKPRLYISGQFIFAHNPVQYREDTESRAIIKRTVVPPVISSINNHKDTLVYYVPYKSGFELGSSSVYHLSGGVGYQLLNKGRISLEGALFLNFSWTRFNYRISRVNSDTGIFVNNILTSNVSATAFYESVESSAAPMPVYEKKQVMSLSLNPCLSFVYQLNKKTGLLLRPAYMMQLSKNTLQVNAKSYQLKEHNWFIHLGLRHTF